MSETTETYQLSLEAAEFYEDKFVPALFGQWAPLLVDAAKVRPGQAVLDVACGTGVVAREASSRVGPQGRVVGLDMSPAMLSVARRIRPDLEWQEGDAADLPFHDSSFDVTFCQSSLMFFPDTFRALEEMRRVTKDHGTVAVQVYAELDSQPGYGPFVEIVVRHAGSEARELMNTYWRLGDEDRLREMFTSVGLRSVEIESYMGSARFASTEEMVETELRASPLMDRIDDGAVQQIVDDSLRELQEFQTGDGAAHIPIRALFVTAHE